MNHHTNKKTYQKPFMEVVELQQNLQLLTGSSGVTATRSGYGSAVTETWESSSEDASYNDYIQYILTLSLLN